MQDNKLLNRIVIDPEILAGKPIIKGTRLSVQYILKLLSNGAIIEDVLKEYNDLHKEDILACLLFATKAVEQSSFYPLQIKAM